MKKSFLFCVQLSDADVYYYVLFIGFVGVIIYTVKRIIEKKI